MMLADKIMKERKKKGWSQEELAERLDVSRQSVSKWEGGLSVPDLDKIIAMSEIFGVSTDYLLKKEQDQEPEVPLEKESPRTEEAAQTDSPVRAVSHEEVLEYMACVDKRSPRIAFGVMLCILSPITLILLAGFSSLELLSGSVAIAIGLLVLFVLVAAAVAVFIFNGMPLLKYEYLEKESICISAETELEVTSRYDAYQFMHRMMVTVGCALCMIGVIPLVVLAVLTESAIWVLVCVGILLVTVSVGVFLFVRTCYINGSYQRLLQIGEFDRETKARENELLQTVYWCVITAVYLGLSFLTGAWHITWLIWVIAGVMSPVFDYILKRKKH